MRKIPIALQLYSLRRELPADFLGVLKAVKVMGYEGVEFFGPFAQPAEVVRAMLYETGLEIVGWHTPVQAVMPGMLEATISYNKVIGNKNIVVPALPREMGETKEGWLKAAETLNAAGKRLAQDGMRTGFHNHAGEFAPIGGELPYDILFGNTCDCVITQMDTGTCVSTDNDPAAFIRKYPGRAATVHCKPYSKATGYETIIGQDDTNWESFVSACREVGGTEWLIVEYESGKPLPPLDGVKHCLDALKHFAEA